MANNTQRKPHALLVSYPLQGHVIPSINLAMAIAAKGFTITYVNTQSIHHQTAEAQPGVGDDIFVGARESGFDIHYEVISDGLPVGFDRSLNHDQFMASLLHVLSAHVEELVVKMIQSDHPISCIIADTFFVWPSAIAKKYGLIYVSFWTEPALVFTLYYHLDLLRKHGHFGTYDNREDTINYIPGVPTIEPTDLPSYLQENDTSTVCHQIIFKAFGDAKGADYVLCNTVQELESETISALQINKPFYPIGPIFSSSGFSKRIVAASLWSESNCAEWLDPKPPGSVLYVSFGSYAHVNKRDLAEIAMGVLHSEVNFIWVLRPDIVSSGEKEPLPSEFWEGCEKKGKVVPWCQQNAVLSHPSVGGFLTHCGWNSIMESVWCGIPLLCFPLLTDQFTNRKLVVDDLKIGLDLIGQRRMVTREEVSIKIKDLMVGKLSDDLRKEVKQVKHACQNALNADGSSQSNLDLFINDVKNRVQSRQH
ncbi:hypothetical protein MRB53_001240 [Persea americana]|uniref:Uncharacterized protein n=1 Tax=Persea americana TaxID=3435 RepID=A0ACC2MR43_PERAE|nr:hypothetical protein MRB53_001240 [Persea americana]